jgi:hypothetical protein
MEKELIIIICNYCTLRTGDFWPATAATGVRMEAKRIPLVTGGDRFTAWLVFKKCRCDWKGLGTELLEFRIVDGLGSAHSMLEI